MFVGTLTRVGILLSSVVFPALAQTRIPVRLSHPKAVLPRPGSRLELVVPSLPKGAYRFSAVTHLAYRMTGVLVVP